MIHTRALAFALGFLLLATLLPSLPTALLPLGLAAASDDPAPDDARFDPVVREVHGFRVHVDPALLDGPRAELGARALGMLANHLERVAILVEPSRLERLRACELWIEDQHPELVSMQYHPSVEWLRAHGHDPRLAKKVHLPRAEQLLSRSQLFKHPAVILHELAHAYHDQVLGFDEPRIRAAFDAAVEAGRYAEVLDHRGVVVRHYALSNHKEYFAEGSEAYFYRNDFYPFVAAELREHDPVLHELLVEIWGASE